MREAAPLRVLTWNIHGGIGRDGRYDLDRILALARSHHPDVVALQEVDSRGRLAALAPLLHLQQGLGEHSAEARTITAPDGHYGHVLISRYPLSDIALHDLSVPGREPRFAIEAVVNVPGGAVRVAATHLGLGFRERQRQARQLASLALGSRGPMVVLGDFNDWQGSVRRILSPILPAWTSYRTFPARRPFLGLDGIYCRPVEALVRSWTDSRAAHASDHLPVLADIGPPHRPAVAING